MHNPPPSPLPRPPATTAVNRLAPSPGPNGQTRAPRLGAQWAEYAFSTHRVVTSRNDFGAHLELFLRAGAEGPCGALASSARGLLEAAAVLYRRGAFDHAAWRGVWHLVPQPIMVSWRSGASLCGLTPTGGPGPDPGPDDPPCATCAARARIAHGLYDVKLRQLRAEQAELAAQALASRGGR